MAAESHVKYNGLAGRAKVSRSVEALIDDEWHSSRRHKSRGVCTSVATISRRWEGPWTDGKLCSPAEGPGNRVGERVLDCMRNGLIGVAVVKGFSNGTGGRKEEADERVAVNLIQFHDRVSSVESFSRIASIFGLGIMAHDRPLQTQLLNRIAAGLAQVMCSTRTCLLQQSRLPSFIFSPLL